jgi:hypothetical protein
MIIKMFIILKLIIKDLLRFKTLFNLKIGESIAITADFENHSRRTIVPHATLYQTQTFLAGGKSRSRRFKFTIVTGLAIQPRRTANWDAQLLKIPAVSPSIINCCLIKVDYAVRITLQIPFIAYNLTVDLPIVIGTVPLRRQTASAHYRDPLSAPSEARITFYPPVPAYADIESEDISTTRMFFLVLFYDKCILRFRF